MEKIHTQGIITHAIPFKEYDRIITVFTPNDGLIKIVVKGAFSQKHRQGASTSPLTTIEIHCSRNRSELFSCNDLEVVNSNFDLRANLKILEAACEMLRVVTATQLPGKAAPDLYRLLIAYLRHLPNAANINAVTASFKLKTLRHEGLLELPSNPTPTMPKDEHDLILALAYSVDFSLIASLHIPDATAEKINHMFEKGLR